MRYQTIVLNEKLIRAAKGMIRAWEEWVQSNKKENKQ